MSIATVRALIADDSEIFRRGLSTLLSQHPGKWEICAEAADGEEALRKVEALRPDVILLDLSIPNIVGPGCGEGPKAEASVLSYLGQSRSFRRFGS